MEWLNYHHLLYFWTVAKEGTIARAGRTLRLAQPTISAQIRTLEEALGERLFERAGRGLELTEVGRMVYRYADEIFSLGREMLDTLKDRPTGKPARLTVGVDDVLPKLIAYHLIEPALRLPDPVRVVVREDRSDRLLAALAIHELDLVLTDAPVPPAVKVRGYNHLLGECPVALFAAPPLARRLRRGFPRSLDGAPLLLPAEGTSLRRSLDQWTESIGIRPRVVGEFDDSALMKSFGQAGAGAFPAPAAIAREIATQHHVREVATLPDVRERFYAVSVDRRLKHPAVVAICEAARRDLFR